MPIPSGNGRNSFLSRRNTHTGFCRDNDNSILEPSWQIKRQILSATLLRGEEESCSRARHGAGGLATILNPLLTPVPRGWSHCHFTVEEKRFHEEEWLVQGLRARRSRAGIQSQRSISFPNPHSFWRTKVNTTQKWQVLLCILCWPLKNQPKKMGKIETELTPTHLGPCSLYSALPQSSCVFTSYPRKSGNLRWPPQPDSHSSYTLNPERDSRREDGSREMEDVTGPCPCAEWGARSPSHDEIHILEVSVWWPWGGWSWSDDIKPYILRDRLEITCGNRSAQPHSGSNRRGRGWTEKWEMS